VPKRLATVIGSWPSAWTTAGGKTLAVLLCHLGIKCVPLGLEHAAEDSVISIVGGGFQVVQGGFWLEGGDIGCRKIERGKFRHLVGVRIVHAADQHADVAIGYSFVT
jgi:hypothetical protein